jgi:hypothetical protein
MRTSDQSISLDEVGTLPANEHAILGSLPTPNTPGFQRATTRAFQVLLALLDRAVRLRTLSASPVSTTRASILRNGD